MLLELVGPNNSFFHSNQTGNLPLVIDQLQFSVRPHTLTIEAFGASVNDSTELQFNGIDEDTLPGTKYVYDIFKVFISNTVYIPYVLNAPRLNEIIVDSDRCS